MYINKSKDSTKMLAAPKDGKVCFYDKIDSQSPSITLNAPLTCFVGEQAFNNAVKLGRDAKVQVDGVENKITAPESLQKHLIFEIQRKLIKP